jgi:DNA repair protein RadC
MPAEVTPDQQQIVSVLLSSGKYPTEKAVLDEALELLQQRDKLRGLLQTGIDELDAGKRVPAAEAMQRLRASLPAAE